MRRLVYYIAVSLDGFIADVHGGTDAFPNHPETLNALFDMYPETCPVHFRDVLGITAPSKRFDAVIMGAETHRPAVEAGMTSAYPHLDQYVVTHHAIPSDSTVKVINDDVADHVQQMKAHPGKDIWLCGGADLAGQLIDHIDEIQLKVNPITLGSGIPLFRRTSNRAWSLATKQELPGGVILLTYQASSAGSADRP